MPIVLEVCPATTGELCNDTFGGPNCNVRSCLHCPLHSLCLEKAQTSTPSGRASVRARGREPQVTGIPSAPLEPSPFLIRLRHHLSRTTGVHSQHQHRGTVECRRGIRPSVRMWIVFQKRHKANFPLAQDAAAPFLITFFDNWWYETAGPPSLKTFSGRGSSSRSSG